jgi:rare lipoprotein A (peptidoglycan hydrolase)
VQLVKGEPCHAEDNEVSSAHPLARRKVIAATATLAVLFALPATAASAVAHAPPGVPGTPRTSVTQADLRRLDADLDKATKEADKETDALLLAASKTAGLRIDIAGAAEEADAGRQALRQRIREIYMTGRPDPVTQMLMGVRGDANSMLSSAASAGVQTDQELIDRVNKDMTNLDRLRGRLDSEQQAIIERTRRVRELQQDARVVLEQAQQRYAGDQAKLAAIAARRARLEAQADQVMNAVKPAVTERGRNAAAAEAPIIATLEAAGAGFPAGYRATGRTIVGDASWYGPGFYGHPTATGAPYDAERFTCAMLAVPLGTVVRVTTDDGRAVNVLVNDRGPYVHGRVIDMSAAGARMLGFSGVKHVTVEVLERTG